jgi:hypothetical protein
MCNETLKNPVENNSSSRKWLLTDMRDQFHIYTSRKSGEFIEESSTFKQEGKVKEPDIQTYIQTQAELCPKHNG